MMKMMTKMTRSSIQPLDDYPMTIVSPLRGLSTTSGWISSLRVRGLTLPTRSRRAWHQGHFPRLSTLLGRATRRRPQGHLKAIFSGTSEISWKWSSMRYDLPEAVFVVTFVPVVVTEVLMVWVAGLTTIALRTLGGGGPSMMKVWPLLSLSPR